MLSFFAPAAFAVGTGPQSEAVGDFNGDGKSDIAVVNQGANTVSVLVGKGDGTFQPRTDYATGTSPSGVAVGDFNGDGKADLVVVNKGANSLSLLLGNGDGTYQAKTDIALPTTPVPFTPVAVTVGDFNGDGHADLAVAGHNTSQDEVAILLGNGNGTFQAAVTTVTDTAPSTGILNLGLAGGPTSILSGDFNGDGHTDLVVLNNRDMIVVTAVGRFGVIISTAVQPEPDSVSMLLGNGNGTFQAPTNFAVGSNAQSVAAGDFNGDGRLDFAVNNSAPNSVSIFTNAGSGSFSSSTLVLGAGVSGTLATGDFNGDGITDLAVPTISNAAIAGDFTGVRIFDGQSVGSLQAGASYTLGLGAPVAADLNGDGHVDLVGIVGTSNNTGAVEPWLNNGDGTFPAPKLIAAAGVALASQATGDFNGDGIPDLVTPNQVYLGLGDGRFGDPTPLPGPVNSTFAAVDADGNGTTDVLVGNPTYPTGQVAAWFNSPGYDNRTGGAVGFTISAPSQVVAGGNTSVTVTAVDGLGNPVPNFLGTVDLDFTPAGSTALNLAGQYTFTAADNGRHTFLFSNLTRAGADMLSVFAAGMPTATAPVTVVPAALSLFASTAPATVPAGTPFAFTVTAEDRFGNVETGYAGTVHFSALANDSQAVLPADYTFTAADAGSHTFGATLFKTSGASSPFINTKDIATGVNSNATILVTPLAASSLVMTNLPNPFPAGTPYGVTVTPLDVYGNVATSYTGTVHFTSSDPRASLPADYTFRPGQSAGGFSIILKTLGTQSVTVADTTNPAFTATQAGINVVPGAPVAWVFSGLSAGATAGTAQTFTLTAIDAAGNVATNFFDTVHFTSSDAQAVLPASYTFTPADAGSHTFTVMLKTAGTQSLTVADTGNVLAGTASINVTAAAAATMTLTGFPASIAGSAQNFTLMLRDAFGNLASGYTGTVAFSSSDPIAALPASYTFTTADAGVHTFTATLKRAGTQSITATDTAAPTLTSTESGIAMSPGAVVGFAISGPTSVTQGVGFKITVSAVDAYGNVNAGYRGAVHLSSTDSTGGTQNFTFSNNDNGVHIFSYTFNALGLQTLAIVDTTNSSITGGIVIDVLPKT